MEILFYLGFGIALGLAIYLGLKYKVKKEQIEQILDILTLMKYINKRVNYAQQDDLERILEYTVAIGNYLVPYVEKGDYEYVELIKAIINDTFEFCEEEGIRMNEDLETIIRLAADFIVTVWFDVH
jgi:hypothetical protein